LIKEKVEKDRKEIKKKGEKKKIEGVRKNKKKSEGKEIKK